MKSLILAASLFAIPSFAYAGDFQPVKHGSYLVDLDTQDGNFSLWKTSDVSDVNALRAHLTLLRKGSGKYAPSVVLSLLSGDKRVSLKVIALPKSGPMFLQVVKDNDDKTGQMILTPPEFQEAFDIHVRWTPDGKVSFDVYSKANKDIGQGFEHHEVDLGGAVTDIEITNSTGEAEFNKLELGNEAP